jgi:hypothetical protein
MSESNFFEKGINGAVDTAAAAISESGDVPAGVSVVAVTADPDPVAVNLPDPATNSGRCITVLASDITAAITVTTAAGSIVGFEGPFDATHRSATYCSDGTDWYANPFA